MIFASFIVLNFPFWIGIPLLGIMLMTLGEILGFPFSNTHALNRAQRGNKGSYMALYSMSFSVANIAGPNIGMQLTNAFGFETTWYVMAFLLLIAAFCIALSKRMTRLQVGKTIKKRE
ncbi:MAG: MFS transporter [Flavobacteriaceae bacterium]|nr:MFS transporter [Flavobacteriaceae bacterium]